MQLNKGLLVSGLVSAALMFAPALASASTVYNAVPATLAPNYASQPFQAQQTSEFGDYVHLGGTDRVLTTVTVTMSNWAIASSPENVAFCAAGTSNCDATGFNWPITVNIYSNHLDINGTPDTLLATKTVTQHIAWRPEGPICPTDSTAYVGADSQCYHGLASNITFDLSSLNVVLPDDVIVSLAYNTETYGAAPTGIDGPYDSLNVAVPNTDPVTVGSDDNTDAVFWNSTTGTGGIFRQDTGWTPYGTVAMQINAISPIVETKGQCLNSGWKNHSDGTNAFKNQGDCVSFVATKGKNTAAVH